MIKSITLKNWQCHKDKHFDLEKITVFTGDNDAGKSAVIRALKWLALNEWDGEADTFISWGEEGSKVIVSADGATISRAKGKGHNTYSLADLNNPNGEDEEYKAFGTKVPEKIAKILNITIDNFQDQSDPAFWLSLNNSQAASALNEIFNLTSIDTTLSNIGGELRQARARVEVTKERLQQARSQKTDLQWTIQANKELAKIESLDTEVCDKQEQLAELESLGRQLSKTLKFQKSVDSVIAAGEKALQVGEELLAAKQKLSKLQTILSKGEELLRLTTSLVKKEQRLEELLKGRCPLCQRLP